jgi:integrase/recombinase XerD
MSRLAERAEEYLRLRRALGHKLDDAVRLLPRFVAYLDATGSSTITTESALAWTQQPDAGPGSSVWARRMTVARDFARYMSGLDPATEIPPLGLVTFRKHWRPPFIYSESDVEALMAAVPQLVPSPFRAATFQTMIGLLAVSGLRVGEVIALGRCDVDWAEDLLVVRPGPEDPAGAQPSPERPADRSVPPAVKNTARRGPACHA